MKRTNIEEILVGLIGLMVIISVATTLFASLNISSIINTSFFGLIIIAMLLGIIIEMIKILKKAF